MNLFPCRIFSITTIIVSLWLKVEGSPAPNDVSSLAVAKGCLFAGTFSGKIFMSQDSGLHWTDVSFGLCDSSRLEYQETIKCIKVTGDDSIHAITACGEFVSTAPEIHWKQLSADSCIYEYCPQCIPNMEYSARVNEWMIKSFITGPIEWSRDSGKTWTVAVPGCPYCSMPIINCIFFDTISALAGLYGRYGMVGYNSNIIVSIDSGRTWHTTGLAGLANGVSSITRMGSIAFAGAEDGIYASRDDFTTWWMVGESSDAEPITIKEPSKKGGAAIAILGEASRFAFVISMNLNAAALTSIFLCDLSGRRVAMQLGPTTLSAGNHRIPLSFNENNFLGAGGLFMCVVKVGNVVKTFKMPIIR